MGKQKIIIRVDDRGNVQGDVVGGQGASCLNSLDELLKDIAVAVDVEYKPGFFNQGQSPQNSVYVDNNR